MRSSLIGIAIVFVVFWVAGPATPQGGEVPFVKSVGFYQDWQLTQPINTAVEPGTTIYTKIVFSEPMKLKVADDNTARPVLYYRIGEEQIRYRIARHGASGADFVSGDAKPLHGGSDDYICKYTIPEDPTGDFRTLVGKLSADTSGNTMESFYTHSVRLTFSRDVAPAVVTGAGDPNLTQPTIGEEDGDPNLTQPIDIPFDPETIIDVDMLDATGIIAPVDPAPDERPPLDEAFIFRKCIEHLISDIKATILIDDAAFQPPGKGFSAGSPPGPLLPTRLPNTYILGTFIPDPVTSATLLQINRFSAEYKLTVAELDTLLGNLWRASIFVVDPDWHVVSMPDQNLRKVVVAAINEQGVSSAPSPIVSREAAQLITVGIVTRRPKEPIDPIYAWEMREIEELRAEAVGIKWLTGLEHATNLRILYLGNVYSQDWDVISIEAEPNYKYTVTKPETPNRISDLTPLENLTKLTWLDLECNAVSNLYPVRNLTNLRVLRLGENEITDVSPLADLTNLEYLDISNDYYSPLWTGNNAISDLTPLRNLINLWDLRVSNNPIGGNIEVVRNFPKLKYLLIGCCGVSDLRPLVESQGLQAGSHVNIVSNPLWEEDDPDIQTLKARGVGVNHSLHYNSVAMEWTNLAHHCSLSYRESLRAAPALQLPTEPDVLAAVWQDLSQVPEETSLLPNYPNPFNPETWIPYQLATPAEVGVAIHAADGRLVRALAFGYQPVGVYQSKGRAVYWDGRNAQGEPVASGVYFYTLIAGDFTATRKLLIRK